MASNILRVFGLLLPQVTPPPTPASARVTLYHDTNIPNAASIVDNTGLKCAMPKVLARVFASTSFGATTSELVGLSFTGITANDLVAGRLLRVRVWGVSTNIATASTVTLRCRIGIAAVNAVGGAASANAIAASVALTTAAAAKTTVPWLYGADVAIYASGSGGAMLGQCNYAGGPSSAIPQAGTGLTASAALNTTVSNNLDFTIQSGSSSDITQTTVQGGSLEIL